MMEAGRWYSFKVFRPGHAVWKRKQIYAWSHREALNQIDEYCYQNGYIDYELED